MLMKRRAAQDFQVIKGKNVSLEEKTKEILTALEKYGLIDFKEYFERQESLEEALVSFFCLLDLINSRIVVAVQAEIFQTIKVWLRKASRRIHSHD